ncbi:uncharacterized protein [Cherax quadricarinatus]|nr:uncharacterized protein LOC128695371 isoform X2 [Cherax quadricarinatus]XP_053641884.1 uncharacterized protein LOC128695371 isoform X2 [Cherax quadricarinatus]
MFLGCAEVTKMFLGCVEFSPTLLIPQSPLLSLLFFSSAAYAYQCMNARPHTSINSRKTKQGQEIVLGFKPSSSPFNLNVKVQELENAISSWSLEVAIFNNGSKECLTVQEEGEKKLSEDNPWPSLPINTWTEFTLNIQNSKQFWVEVRDPTQVNTSHRSQTRILNKVSGMFKATVTVDKKSEVYTWKCGIEEGPEMKILFSSMTTVGVFLFIILIVFILRGWWKRWQSLRPHPPTHAYQTPPVTTQPNTENYTVARFQPQPSYSSDSFQSEEFPELEYKPYSPGLLALPPASQGPSSACQDHNIQKRDHLLEYHTGTSPTAHERKEVWPIPRRQQVSSVMYERATWFLRGVELGD